MKAPSWTRQSSFETIDQRPAVGVLNVVAIYEDFAAGVRLREALISLGRSLDCGRMVNMAWSFSMLARLDVRAAALHEAADADLLIVVTAGDESLPVQITRWLERCLAESSRRPAALVELHDDVLDLNESPTALSAEMAQFAGRWQMDIVTNRQFDDFLNTDYFRPIIRQPEPASDFSARLP